MRKTVPMRIGDLWSDFVRQTPAVAKGIAESKAAALWPIVVGPETAAVTVSVTVRGGVLTARLNSSVARSALFMQRDALRDAINRAAGEPVVKHVILK